MVTTVQEANTVAFPHQAGTGKRTRAPQPDPYASVKLQLSNLLQTTLELSPLLQLFFEEVKHSVPLDGLSYRSDKNSEVIEFGKNALHSCHYNLITGQNSLGELSFSRSKRFSEQELQRVEMLIGCLICPIRNARLYQEAIQSSLRDPLTNAGNRLALDNTLEREINLAQRHLHPLSILVIDIDKFKAINDNFGHAAGDFVLKDVAQQLSHSCRETDATHRTYRFGGEEFVILLSNTEPQGAAIVAERIRACIEAMTTHYESNSINVTVSVGISSLNAQDSMATLFERADKALFQAKQNGRNQIVDSAALKTE